VASIDFDFRKSAYCRPGATHDWFVVCFKIGANLGFDWLIIYQLSIQHDRTAPDWSFRRILFQGSSNRIGFEQYAL
jgi:hypothetical protein